MNKYISLLLPVIMTVSLVGCNTLVTKPSSGRVALSQQHTIENEAHENQDKDSYLDATYRIDAEPIALAFVDEDIREQSSLFATKWQQEEQPDQNQTNPTVLASHPIQPVKQNHLEAKKTPTLQIPSVTHTTKTSHVKEQVKESKLSTPSSQANQPTTKPVVQPPIPTKTQPTLQSQKPNTQKSIKKKRLSKTHLRSKKVLAKQQSEQPSTNPKSNRSAKQINKPVVSKNVAAQKISSTTATKLKKRHYSSKQDLWERIRQGYQLPQIDNPQIQHFVDKYTKHSHYVTRISNKARPYLYHIVKEIEKRGMPLEIALLPAIESAYEPMALSHKSAAGLWQFVPATGTEYGLKQNDWYDARRDIIASTSAALNYLRRLHKLFDQDWLLALAAYNYGQGNLGKAINKNWEQEQPTDFWSLELPKETREYVPKLLALAKIVANSKEYGVKLSSIANQPYLKRIKMDHPIELSLAADLSGLSSSEFKRLNASFRRDAPDPEGPYSLTLPLHSIKKFKQRLAQIPLEQRLFNYASLEPENQPTTNPPSPTKEKVLVAAVSPPPMQQHQVSKGENLWHIAKQYNTTVAMLSELNNLKIEQALHVGKSLDIPITPTAKVADNSNNEDAQRSTKVDENESQPEPTKVALAVPDQITQQHQIKPGETLWNIAKRYQTTVSVLRRLNELKNNSLIAGQFLVVPTTVATLKKSIKVIQ